MVSASTPSLGVVEADMYTGTGEKCFVV